MRTAGSEGVPQALSHVPAPTVHFLCLASTSHVPQLPPGVGCIKSLVQIWQDRNYLARPRKRQVDETERVLCGRVQDLLLGQVVLRG